jgi:hypothetical protein
MKYKYEEKTEMTFRPGKTEGNRPSNARSLMSTDDDA